ncbi:hypothetical protein [Nonomuraea dietziae]|uniref:Uncharacterized protein n=1 Tax=Nonomuraea dietziae TaxID=65515 RepID=A0A7W5VH79_9ACTN|nr:hypothetical protein [Nonomuraea dietziae]MBB3731509.1 hypothetical protein [Nonomuraea dietziae]
MAPYWNHGAGRAADPRPDEIVEASTAVSSTVRRPIGAWAEDSGFSAPREAI